MMRYALLLFLAFVPVFLHAQEGYNLDFKVNGLKDTTAYLGYYYGESTYVSDTAKVNGKGEFNFKGSKTLDRGVYMLIVNKIRLFEFVVGANRKFRLETDTADYVKNMKVTGDLDNKLFFDNMTYNMDRHKEAEPFLKVIQDSTLAEDKKKDARAAFAKINEKVLAYQADIIAKNPNTVTGTIFKANQPLTPPAPPRKANGQIDSTFQLRWYRQHYFDNFDLADDALIRMPRPMYRERMDIYLDKLYLQHPDTLIKALDRVVGMAKKNKETYKFSVFNALLKYQNPEIMGIDAVFVHIYDKYIATGEMDFWVNAPFKKNLKEHADRLRNSLVGKQAPNLIMQDLTGKPRSMYDIKKRYTILFIYDPECSHCKVETPKLVAFYNKNKERFNLEVFGVCADTTLAKMRKYIQDMGMKWINVNGPRTYTKPYQELYDAQTTPSLYLMDDKKKIIAKKIPIEKLEEFLIHYEKTNKPKPPAPKK